MGSSRRVRTLSPLLLSSPLDSPPPSVAFRGLPHNPARSTLRGFRRDLGAILRTCTKHHYLLCFSHLLPVLGALRAAQVAPRAVTKFPYFLPMAPLFGHLVPKKPQKEPQVGNVSPQVTKIVPNGHPSVHIFAENCPRGVSSVPQGLTPTKQAIARQGAFGWHITSSFVS